MNTIQAKMPSWVGAVGVAPSAWPMSVPAALRPGAEAPLRTGAFTLEEMAAFMRIVTEAGRIRCHAELHRWLTGDVQQFLPHEVLLAAYGDFAGWNLKLDLVSGLPGMRTAALAHCPVDGLVREAYGRWVDGGRNPVVLKTAEMAAQANPCQCPVHVALRGMRSVLIHGANDRRSEQESLFIAFSPGSFNVGRSVARFIDVLFAQIDHAFRKVPAYPLREPRLGTGHAAVLELSAREIEVVEAICRGRTNLEIGAALSISPFTVKNHVQRIFRKIGVTNRTHAAARYAEALLHTAVTNVARAQEALREAG